MKFKNRKEKMDGFSQEEEEEKKKASEIKTFLVPFTLQDIKENITIDTNNADKPSKEQIISQAFKFHSEGNISEAAKFYQSFIDHDFKDQRVFSNYGVILKKLGKLHEAEKLYRKAIKLNPHFSEAYLNLGNILRDLGKFQEAENSYRKAIELNPHFAEAYLNLGNILRNLGNTQEAEKSYHKAIKLNPHYGDAHSNLGIILRNSGHLKEAEFSTRKAIELNPNLAEAHSNLGGVLIELGNLTEAELSTRKAIELNPNLATCYQNLSLLLYTKDNINLALKNIKKACSLDPISQNNQLLLTIFRDRKRKIDLNMLNTKDAKIKEGKSNSYPIILNRPVEQELINSLYKIKAFDLNKFSDPSYGNARGSDYKLFEDNEKVTNKLKNDLTSITKEIVNANVFFRDSFFTILSGPGKIKKHNHVGSLDKLTSLNLWKQKYALVYYLSIGDQNCKEPGILKFYKDNYEGTSNKEILPVEGMIVIFPANTYHSVEYDGNKDRIIIGVNFYSI